MRVETDRILIRSFHEDDTDAYHDIVRDERVTRYLSDGIPHDLQTASNYVQECMSLEINGCLTRYAIVWKGSGKLVGFSGFKLLSGLVDFGYRLSPAFWGRGIATEAGFAVLNYGKRDLAIQEITARVIHGNVASIGVLRKLGFEAWEGPEIGNARFEWFRMQN